MARYVSNNYDDFNYRSIKHQRIARRKRIQRLKRMIAFFITITIFCLCGTFIFRFITNKNVDNNANNPNTNEAFFNKISKQNYPKELQNLLKNNSETKDFVKAYPDRQKYIDKKIDLKKDYKKGQVPLLMQWDKRWGYNMYGENYMAVSGCGPTCLSMAYIYLTGDTSKNPYEMAKFAEDNGYYSSAGTEWTLWTVGSGDLGLHGEELRFTENSIKNTLDEGNVVICSMTPGDFTTTGHYILIRGYDENGFFVNDPNRKSTSHKQWDFDTLSYQIKNLWSIGR